MLATTGLRLYDRSGQGNHGTLTNMDAASDWVTAKVRNTAGRVLDFDGSNDYVGLPSTFPVIAAPFSLSAWVRSTSTAGNSIVVAYRSTTAINPIVFQLSRGDSNYQFIVRNNAGTITNISSASVTLNAWTHLAARQSGSDMRLFVNGAQVASGTAPTGAITVDSINIGATVSGSVGRSSFWVGQIAEVGILSRAMTASEIRTLYRIGPGWFGKRDSRVFGYSEQFAAGFKAYWARRQSQLIGGGL